MPTNYTALLLYFAIGFILPWLVDLVTKRFANASVKSLLLLVLSLVAGLLANLFDWANTNSGDITGFDWQTWLFASALTFASSVVTLFGIGKPTKIQGADGFVAKAVPGGVGTIAAPVPVAPNVTLPPDGGENL